MRIIVCIYMFLYPAANRYSSKNINIYNNNVDQVRCNYTVNNTGLDWEEITKLSTVEITSLLHTGNIFNTKYLSRFSTLFYSIAFINSTHVREIHFILFFLFKLLFSCVVFAVAFDFISILIFKDWKRGCIEFGQSKSILSLKFVYFVDAFSFRFN